MSIESLPKYVLREVLSYLNLKEFCSFQSGITNKNIHKKINNLIDETEKTKNFFALLKEGDTVHLKDLARCTKTIPIFQLISSCTFVNSEIQLMEKLPLFIHENLNSLNSLIKFDIYFPGLKSQEGTLQENILPISQGWLRIEKDEGPPYKRLESYIEEDFNAKTHIVFLGNLDAIKSNETFYGGSSTGSEGYKGRWKMSNYLRNTKTKSHHSLGSQIIDSVSYCLNRGLKAVVKPHLPTIHAEKKLTGN